MEQISPRHVLSVLENRLKTMMEKASLYPEFVEPLARIASATNLVKRLCRMGAEFYLSPDYPPSGWFPIDKRFLEIYGVLKRSNKWNLHRHVDGFNYLTVETRHGRVKIHGKYLAVSLGEEQKPFIEYEGELKKAKSEELENMRRYSLMLRRLGITSKILNYNPREEYFYTKMSFNEFHKPYTSLDFPIYFYSEYHNLIRFLTQKELDERERKRIEAEKKKQKLNSVFEEIASGSREIHSENNFGIWEIQPASLRRLKLTEAIERVSEKLYLIRHSWVYYHSESLHPSLPLSYLRGVKYLSVNTDYDPSPMRLAYPNPKLPYRLIKAVNMGIWTVAFTPKTRANVEVPKSEIVMTRKHVIILR